jgi:large subunit ribosomal protein L21
MTLRATPGGVLDYAVIRTGGLQFKVAEGDLIRVPRISSDVGSALEMPDVLALSASGDLKVGKPLVEGARVTAEVVGHGRSRKIIVYKKKRRKGYQRKKGHRQGYTELRITGIAA